MIRTVLVGVVAIVALVGVLSAVFALGVLRIRLAENSGPAPDVAGVPTTVPSTQPIGAPPPAVVQAPEDPKADVLPVLTSDTIDLPAEKAKISDPLKLDKDVAPKLAQKQHKRVGPPDPPPAVHEAIVGWHGESDSAEWTAKVPKEGYYEVDLVYANYSGTKAGLDYTVNVSDQELSGEMQPTKGRESYKVVTVGNAKLSKGEIKVRFHLGESPRYGLLRVRGIRLIPAT